MGLKSYFMELAVPLILISVGNHAYLCRYELGEKCRIGEEVVYNEMKDDNMEYSFCCPMGYEQAKVFKKEAKFCRTSQCSRNNLDHICSTLPIRTVDGVQMVYEEELREKCPGSGLMANSYKVFCCDPSTPQGGLVSTLGAYSNEFPFIAMIKTPNHCAGTIYDKRHIITAAHCVVDSQNGSVLPIYQISVRVGTNLHWSDGPGNDYYVSSVTPHPEYSKLFGKPEFDKQDFLRTYNDIAILKLNRDIVFQNKTIKPIEIAPANFDPSKYANKVLIIGWGISDTKQTPQHLQKANAVLRKDELCFHPYEKLGDGRTGIYDLFTTNCSCMGLPDPIPNVAEQLLCVGGIAEGIWSPNASPGDSGGPAICRDENGYGVLCGVTSFGKDYATCLANNDEMSCRPSVYADVSYFRDWIIHTTGGIQEKKDLLKERLYGEIVPHAHFPHQVYITSSDGKRCGGTLVKNDTVVTAAQCVATEKYLIRPDQKIYAKIFDSGNSTEVNIFKIKNNGTDVKWFNGWKLMGKLVKNLNPGNRIVRIDDSYHYDIAIIKLDGEVNILEDKLPILPEYGCKNLERMGTEVSFPLPLPNTTDFVPGFMMKREFRLLKESTCRSRLSGMKELGLTFKLDNSIICGIESFSGGSTCDRELGGGLICNQNGGRDILCGVQMFRLCESALPNGFVNVAHFTHWIKLYY